MVCACIYGLVRTANGNCTIADVMCTFPDVATMKVDLPKFVESWRQHSQSYNLAIVEYRVSCMNVRNGETWVEQRQTF